MRINSQIAQMTNLNKKQLRQLRLQISDETITYVAKELKISKQTVEAIFNKSLDDYYDVVLKCTMTEYKNQLKLRKKSDNWVSKK